MFSVDIFSCYAVAGVGSLVGLGLISLIQTEQPRVSYALFLYRCAFVCLAMLGAVIFAPPDLAPWVAKGVIGFAGMGVTLLAWAFRQLNGRRTPPWLGTLATIAMGASLWGFAFGSDEVYEQALGITFAVVSLGMAIDQGWLILRSARVNRSELTLLVVAGGFALHWVFFLVNVLTVPGPYPAHWLHSPGWLLPISGISFALLPLAVASVVFAIINDRLNQQLRARALSDELTGALSRRGLRELGERMLAMQEHQPSLVAVLMLDVDYFKAVNDRYGHLIGDDVLKHITHVVRDRLREDALLARYGGEEFTILLPVHTTQEAHGVAERLRHAIESTPCETKVGPIRITISIGVSFHCPNSSLEEDLSRADVRLYEAKQNGRNRVVFGDNDC
ncbi:GGDEF domain-containing protein [Aquabacterium sp.]|uniref:GGDEF domain-containing protein n=1 Tax=Aquabacterium sp. TaxID=1872578 RepID=UPI003D6CDE63